MEYLKAQAATAIPAWPVPGYKGGRLKVGCCSDPSSCCSDQGMGPKSDPCIRLWLTPNLTPNPPTSADELETPFSDRQDESTLRRLSSRNNLLVLTKRYKHYTVENVVARLESTFTEEKERAAKQKEGMEKKEEELELQDKDKLDAKRFGLSIPCKPRKRSTTY